MILKVQFVFLCLGVDVGHFCSVLLAGFFGLGFFSMPSQEIGWEKCLQSDIDISQGSAATRLGCGGVFKYDCYTFPTEFYSERISKIG